MTGQPEPADLIAYADGRLDPARAAIIARFLEAHPETARQVEGWRAQTVALKEALDPVLDAPVPAPLLALLRRGRGERQRSAAAALLAGLAAFPAGLALGWYLWSAPPGSGPETLARTGLASHALYAVEVRHPVEVGAAEEQHLVAWLTKRLDAPVTAPDLSPLGLSLLGGRLVSAGGDPGALLMYESQSGERFTLLIARYPEQPMTAFRYAEHDGLGAFYWIDDHVGYVLTGPADRAALLAVAEAVYAGLD